MINTRRKRGLSFSTKLQQQNDQHMMYTNPDPSNIPRLSMIPMEEVKQPRIFKHSSQFRRIWEYVILVVTFSTLIEVSFFGIFIKDISVYFYIPFMIFDAIYAIDLYVYLHTSYFSHGVQVTDLYRIRNHIGKRRIWIHILALLPISWIGIFKCDRYIYLGLSVLRLLRVQRGIDASDTISKTLIYSWNWSQLFQSILLELLCIHLFACIFYLSAYFEIGVIDSWVIIQGWDDLTPPQQYVVSIYFVMTTILTIGFGDLTPKTSSERIVVIFIQLIGVMINAYIIGMMVSSLLDPIGNRFTRSFRIFVDFMDFKDISDDLKKDVILYFQAKWDKFHGTDDLRDVLKYVPETVRDHLKLDMTRQCLNQISMMQIASEKLLVGFTNSMSPISFVPGEVIFSQGEIDSELYLFRSGVIRLFVNGNEFRTENCDHGIGMGELELLIDTPRSMTVVAVTYVEGWVLERQDLITSFSHQRELRQELLQVCKMIFPDHYKQVRRLLYGVGGQKPKLSRMRRLSMHFSDEQDSSDNFEFVKPIRAETPGNDDGSDIQ